MRHGRTEQTNNEEGALGDHSIPYAAHNGSSCGIVRPGVFVIFESVRHRTTCKTPDRSCGRTPSKVNHGNRLLDHLVGTGDKRMRERKPKGPRSLKIDDQIELRRLLYR